MNKNLTSRTFAALDALIAGGLAILAAIVYFATQASYAFPGQSAHLMALWKGLDSTAQPPYPLMAVFAKLFGGGNLIAPVCGIVSVVLIYLLVRFLTACRIQGEQTTAISAPIGRVAGIVAALVYLTTPAVHEAATHLEPRLFDATWALLAFAFAIPYVRAPKALSTVFPLAFGVMCGLGFCDSALFLALAPFFVALIVIVSLAHEKKPYLPVFLYALAGLVTLLFAVRGFDLDLSELLRSTATELKDYYKTPGWFFVAAFATLPFVTTLFSSFQAYNQKPGLVTWIYHAAMTVVSILAVATPLAPSELMQKYGILPVVTSVFAACVAGHLVSFWWIYRKQVIAISVGGIFLFVLVVTGLWNVFSFDSARGAFADRVAEKILQDLGERRWFVTDGLLDDHLLLAAARQGKELNLISLNRDLDNAYLEKLAKIVQEKGVGGSKNEELVMSLSLGVLPFVQDWFAADPSVPKDVAIYGAPDLWYTAGLKPIPEFLFFGADAKRASDWRAWKEFDAILKAPKGWGSYSKKIEKDPAVRMRHSIRRHLGLVANDRGVYLQDEGHDDEAFAMYERVLGEIDSDNVCALFNEIEMANAKYAKALAKQRELERELKVIVEDKDRRYYIWRLGNYYGYIRNPDIFVRLGYTWARSGRPGDALTQIRRAIDFVPTDKKTVLLNMMAALYANESDHRKSRRIYEQVLARDANDHDALIGMMRLELMDGNSAKALEYLQRAAAQSGTETRRARIELAMLAMMKSDFSKARDYLKKATDAEMKDMQAWSLMAAVTMQQYDASKDEKERAALQKELESVILPAMEKNATGPFDYYVQTTKAFLLLRQGEKKRREARDAFVAATKARPDISATQDLVLGLDISLDDKIQAERHARDVLRRNRDAPLANYVMGSIALGRGHDREAELYLRRSADAPKPVVLALNDLAEVLRRTKNYAEAERYARKAVKQAPKLYVAWETLGSILLDAKRDLKEAQECIQKAIDLSKGKDGREIDVRMLIALARVQYLNGDKNRGRATLREVKKRLNELSDFERREYEDLQKDLLKSAR